MLNKFPPENTNKRLKRSFKDYTKKGAFHCIFFQHRMENHNYSWNKFRRIGLNIIFPTLWRKKNFQICWWQVFYIFSQYLSLVCENTYISCVLSTKLEFSYQSFCIVQSNVVLHLSSLSLKADKSLKGFFVMSR